MFDKHPTWTRTRVGRSRVHWVAYDDRPGGESPPEIIDQGYAASLPEADTAARAALAERGMYQARRLSKGFGPTVRRTQDQAEKPKSRPSFEPIRRREYLYTRHHDDDSDDRPIVAAHLITGRTPRRISVTRKSCGPDQLGTEDETWGENEPTIALDRAKLERDGSVFAGNFRQSEFYPTLEAALGEAAHRPQLAYAHLGISPPCTIDEIKAAYRQRAFEVHPDRGGPPGAFRAVEAAYRRLLREAQAPEA